MSEYKMPEWPTDFDFEYDSACQKHFRPFIQKELAKLRAYDDNRPEDTLYVFHRHAVRVARDVRSTCRHLGLDEIVANNMYWAVLPHDIGKRLLPLDVWDSEEKPDDGTKKFRRTHTLLGAQIVDEAFPDLKHPFKRLMKDIMAYHHEQMDGQGTHEKPAEELSKPVRLTAIVEAFDGYSIWRPHFGDRDITPPGVLERMKEEKGESFFDMELLEAFTEVKLKEFEKLNEALEKL